MSVSSSLLYTGLFCCQTKERMKMEFLSTCFDRWHAVFLRYSSEDSWHVTVSWRIAEACQGELHLHPSIVLKRKEKRPYVRIFIWLNAVHHFIGASWYDRLTIRLHEDPGQAEFIGGTARPSFTALFQSRHVFASPHIRTADVTKTIKLFATLTLTED